MQKPSTILMDIHTNEQTHFNVHAFVGTSNFTYPVELSWQQLKQVDQVGGPCRQSRWAEIKIYIKSCSYLDMV